MADRIELYVLGAGFSKDFVPGAPLLRDFISSHAALLDREHPAAYKYIVETCGYTDLEKANIETVLTLATMSKPWIDAKRKAEDEVVVQQLIEFVEGAINAAFEWKREKPAEMGETWGGIKDDAFAIAAENRRILFDFANRLLKLYGAAHVITFNYDILLENALELVEREISYHAPVGYKKAFHAGESYGSHASKWDEEKKVIEEYGQGAHSNRLYFCKLHGSVRWRARKTFGLPVFPRDLLVLSCHRDVLPTGSDGKTFVDREFTRQAFVVPPILNKAMLVDHPVLNVIWGLAEELVGRAARMAFIGYSFPPTDYYAEYLFRQHTPKDCKLTVVTSRKSRTRKKDFEDRYNDVFARIDAPIDFRDCGAV